MNNRPQTSQDFEDLAPGELLAEFYLGLVIEWDQLKESLGDLKSEQLDRLAELEKVLDVEERKALSAMDEDESLTAWETPRSTGDPLADYWEYRLAKGLSANMELTEPPPRSEWDKE